MIQEFREKERSDSGRFQYIKYILQDIESIAKTSYSDTDDQEYRLYVNTQIIRLRLGPGGGWKLAEVEAELENERTQMEFMATFFQPTPDPGTSMRY